MPTPKQCAATYRCGIGTLLTVAYRCEFTMLEKGKCKTKFPTFDDWYTTLNADQRQRVDMVQVAEYVPREGMIPGSDKKVHLKEKPFH